MGSIKRYNGSSWIDMGPSDVYKVYELTLKSEDSKTFYRGPGALLKQTMPYIKHSVVSSSFKSEHVLVYSDLESNNYTIYSVTHTLNKGRSNIQTFDMEGLKSSVGFQLYSRNEYIGDGTDVPYLADDGTLCLPVTRLNHVYRVILFGYQT